MAYSNFICLLKFGEFLSRARHGYNRRHARASDPSVFMKYEYIYIHIHTHTHKRTHTHTHTCICIYTISTWSVPWLQSFLRRHARASDPSVFTSSQYIYIHTLSLSLSHTHTRIKSYIYREFLPGARHGYNLVFDDTHPLWIHRLYIPKPCVGLFAQDPSEQLLSLRFFIPIYIYTYIYIDPSSLLI